MPFLLAAMLSGAFGWLAYFFVRAWERGTARAKWQGRWKTLQEEGPLLAWNRPLIILLLPIFKKNIYAWEFLLLIEGGFLFCVIFKFSFTVFFSFGLMSASYPPIQSYFEKKNRLAAIQRELPLLMDLLALLVAAGLDMMQALQRISTALPASPLLREIQQMLHDLKLGHTRKEALILFRTRISLFEMRQFLTLLLNALELGAPLAPVLLSGAEQMRQSRFLRAEKAGIQAGQKILIPLIFCILPAVFLTIFAPLFLRFYFGGIEGWL